MVTAAVRDGWYVIKRQWRKCNKGCHPVIFIPVVGSSVTDVMHIRAIRNLCLNNDFRAKKIVCCNCNHIWGFWSIPAYMRFLKKITVQAWVCCQNECWPQNEKKKQCLIRLRLISGPLNIKEVSVCLPVEIYSCFRCEPWLLFTACSAAILRLRPTAVCYIVLSDKCVKTHLTQSYHTRHYLKISSHWQKPFLCLLMIVLHQCCSPRNTTSKIYLKK